MAEIHDKFCELFPLEPGQGIDYDSGEWNGFVAAWELSKPVTETNVPAQASDEPMRAAFEAWASAERYRFVSLNRHRNGQYAHPGIQADWIVWQAAAPRATADVERDAARYRWLREHVVSLVRTRAEKDSELREQEWIDWEASADAHIAATKGAKP